MLGIISVRVRVGIEFEGITKIDEKEKATMIDKNELVEFCTVYTLFSLGVSYTLSLYFHYSLPHQPSVQTHLYPNLLTCGLLVPPNFSLVASVTLTIIGLSIPPSFPNRAFVNASLPGP